jgi:DNA/RNA endonuclease YhcR with UshA esterase domain
LDSDGFNDSYTLNDGSGPVVMFVDGTTGIDQTQVDALIGEVVRVRGSTKCFIGAGEILPRRQSDIVAVSVPVEAIQWGRLKAIYR